jgi:hypothetical protein
MKKFGVILCVLTLVVGGGLFAGPALADTLFYEDFDGGGPGFAQWQNLSFKGDYTYWYLDTNPATGNWAGSGNNAQAGGYGWYWEDVLLSPTIDASLYVDLMLEVGSDWFDWGEDDWEYYMYGEIGVYYPDTDTHEHIYQLQNDVSELAQDYVFDLSAVLDAPVFSLYFYYEAENYHDGEVIADGNWQIDDVLVTGNIIPEPGTVFLLGIGIIGLIGLGRKCFLKK